MYHTSALPFRDQQYAPNPLNFDMMQGLKPLSEDIASIQKIMGPAAAKQALVFATAASYDILVRAGFTAHGSFFLQHCYTSLRIPLAAQHQVAPHPAWSSHV